MTNAELVEELIGIVDGPFMCHRLGGGDTYYVYGRTRSYKTNKNKDDDDRLARIDFNQDYIMFMSIYVGVHYFYYADPSYSPEAVCDLLQQAQDRIMRIKCRKRT